MNSDANESANRRQLESDIFIKVLGVLLALVGAAVALFQALFSRPPWNSEMEARLLRVAFGALGNHLEVMHFIWTRTTPGRVMFVVLVLLVVVVAAWRISLRVSRYLLQN